MHALTVQGLLRTPVPDPASLNEAGVSFSSVPNGVMVSGKSAKVIRAGIIALSRAMFFSHVDLDKLQLCEGVTRGDFCALWLRGKEDFLEATLEAHEWRKCFGAMPWRRIGMASTEEQLVKIVECLDVCFECKSSSLCGIVTSLSEPAARYRK